MVMAKETGFIDRGLVEAVEGPLIEKQLITSRIYGDRTGIKMGKRNRLTDFGNTICEFMLEPRITSL